MPIRPALLVLAALLPLTAVPGAASSSAPVQLAGVTHVEAVGSGTTDVLLPADARVALTESDGVRFAGRGRLLALWLEPRNGAGDFLTSYRLPAFAGGAQRTYGSSPAAQCTPRPSAQLPLTSDCTGSQAPPEAVLGAGRYRLTVLTDGAPVRVTLHLRGLDGTVSTGLRNPLASAQQDLPVREQVGTRLVTYGGSAELGTPVQSFVLATARQAGAVREASTCHRDDAGTQPFAFGPHCPGGTSGSVSYEAGPLMGAGVFASSSSAETTGPVGLGGSFAGSDTVELGQALGVWLEQVPPG